MRSSKVLEKELSSKNQKIAELKAQIESMKAKKHERRVSFSDLDSLFEEEVTSSYSLPDKSFFHPIKRSKTPREINIDGKKIEINIDGKKIPAKAAKATNAPATGFLSLKSIIESRDRGTWGYLTNKQKTALHDATAVFLKQHNLPVGEKIHKLQIAESLQDKFNDYLDYLVDNDIFASPRGRQPHNNFTENMLKDAIRQVDKTFPPQKSTSFEQSEESDSSVRIKADSRIKRKRSANQSKDSDKKIVKKLKKPVLAKQKVIKKPTVSKGRRNGILVRRSKTKDHPILSWFI
jgi:hypothetical protein